MDRDEALSQIKVEITRVENLCSFTGRANILRRLNECYDLIFLYKPTPDYYHWIVRQAKTLLNELQSKMDKESKGGK
jgi:hypothetical protein